MVVLDLRLDGLDAHDNIAAIRRVDPAVALILYSGHPSLLRQAEDAVPDGWVHARLEKPFDPDRLLELLDDLSRS